MEALLEDPISSSLDRPLDASAATISPPNSYKSNSSPKSKPASNTALKRTVTTTANSHSSSSSWRQRAKSIANLRAFQKNTAEASSIKNTTDPANTTTAAVQGGSASNHNRIPPRVTFSAYRDNTNKQANSEKPNTLTNTTSPSKSPSAMTTDMSHSYQTPRPTRLRRISRKPAEHSKNYYELSSSYNAATLPSVGPRGHRQHMYEHPNSSTDAAIKYSAAELHDSGYIAPISSATAAIPPVATIPNPEAYKAQQQQWHSPQPNQRPGYPQAHYVERPHPKHIKPEPEKGRNKTTANHYYPANPHHNQNNARPPVSQDYVGRPSQTAPSAPVMAGSGKNPFELETHSNPIPLSPPSTDGSSRQMNDFDEAVHIPQAHHAGFHKGQSATRVPERHTQRPPVENQQDFQSYDGGYQSYNEYEWSHHHHHHHQNNIGKNDIANSKKHYHQHQGQPHIVPQKNHSGSRANRAPGGIKNSPGTLQRHTSLRRLKPSSNETASQAYIASRLSDDLQSRSSRVEFNDFYNYNGDTDSGYSVNNNRSRHPRSGAARVTSPGPTLRSTSRSPPPRESASFSLPSSPTMHPYMEKYQNQVNSTFNSHHRHHQNSVNANFESAELGQQMERARDLHHFSSAQSINVEAQTDDWQNSQEQDELVKNQRAWEPLQSGSHHPGEKIYHGSAAASYRDRHHSIDSTLHTTSKPTSSHGRYHYSHSNRSSVDPPPSGGHPALRNLKHPSVYSIQSDSLDRSSQINSPSGMAMLQNQYTDNRKDAVPGSASYYASSSNLVSDEGSVDMGSESAYQSSEPQSTRSVPAAVAAQSYGNRKAGRLHSLAPEPLFCAPERSVDGGKPQPTVKFQPQHPTPKNSHDSFEERDGGPRSSESYNEPQVRSASLLPNDTSHRKEMISPPLKAEDSPAATAAAILKGERKRSLQPNPLSPTITEHNDDNDNESVILSPRRDSDHISEKELRLQLRVDELNTIIDSLKLELDEKKTQLGDSIQKEKAISHKLATLELEFDDTKETECQLRDKLDEKDAKIEALLKKIKQLEDRESITEQETVVLRSQFQTMSEQYTKERLSWKTEIERYRKKATQAYQRGQKESIQRWDVIQELVSITRDELKGAMSDMMNGVVSLEKGMRSVKDVVGFSKSFGNIWEELEASSDPLGELSDDEGESRGDRGSSSSYDSDIGNDHHDSGDKNKKGSFDYKRSSTSKNNPTSPSMKSESSPNMETKSGGGADTSPLSQSQSGRSWIDRD
ncbi:hypothetical protein H4219_002800 [Mycoemilia scoparia]|uniref:Uncharacterized protein n=1 Tax=Mycoemilia scoparia TaxID=417184 RepID=A0A9W7ZWN1_9FUNG|nr:hypothetical protein H4219_002800 [Mycoemilia scoparia]